MAKLNKTKWSIILACSLMLLAVIFLSSKLTHKGTSSQSIFRQNVNNQEIGSNQQANPDYEITFPKDHLAHPRFDIEWWYLTANLKDDSGNPYGLQWTLFRFKNPATATDEKLVWHNNHIYMSHASIHSLDQHWFTEKFARGGVGNAGLTSKPFSLFIDNWQWINLESGVNLFPATLFFTVFDSSKNKSKPVNASFSMTQNGPFVLHGDKGLSVKSATKHRSHYYSAPFVSIKGRITSDGSNVNLSGQGWFDHEWSSQLIDSNAEGWDWLSLHLDDGSKIMAFRMRLSDQDHYITGSYISEFGEQITLLPGEINLVSLSTTSLNNRTLPLKWALTIPSKNIDLTISTIKNDQWNNALIPYYEGMVSAKGSHEGNGFLELTGY